MMICCNKLMSTEVIIVNDKQYREITLCKICYRNKVRLLDR